MEGGYFPGGTRWDSANFLSLQDSLASVWMARFYSSGCMASVWMARFYFLKQLNGKILFFWVYGL